MRSEAATEHPLAFAGALIEACQGVVDWDRSGHAFEALLPDPLGERLGVSEALVRFVDEREEGGDPARVFVGFGAEVLDRAIRLAMAWGGTAALRMPAPSSRKQGALSALQALAFPNASVEEKGEQESWLDYWLWSFHLVADADERREALVRTCVSSHGVECPELPDLLFARASDWEALRIVEGELDRSRMERLFLVASDRALRKDDEGFLAFKERVTRHHVRDIQRIEGYFQDLSGEMEKEIQKKQLQGAELEIRLEKIRQLEGEKVRKRAALGDKYRLRISLDPVALLLARIPVRRVDLQIRRRKKERRISAVFNLLSRTFDAYACEACGLDTRVLGFCDEQLHVLCPSCLALFTNGKACPRCKGRRPPSSLQAVLERLDLTHTEAREEGA